jgi:Zn-finger nucleic acid-binding protein
VAEVVEFSPANARLQERAEDDPLCSIMGDVMSEPKEMLCPVCRVALVMSERQGVEIDYCPTCRGVWLDRGELDKIVARAAAMEAAAPAQQQGSSWLTPGQQTQFQQHGPYQQQPKRRSWWGELFDD